MAKHGITKWEMEDGEKEISRKIVSIGNLFPSKMEDVCSQPPSGGTDFVSLKRVALRLFRALFVLTTREGGVVGLGHRLFNIGKRGLGRSFFLLRDLGALRAGFICAGSKLFIECVF